MDEAAFVSAQMMVSVLPLMTVKGRKQIHISSPGQPGSWMYQVGLITTSDGRPFAQVTEVKYKCLEHALVEGYGCPCNYIYIPDQINTKGGYMKGMEHLMNLVMPGSFETELTGNQVTPPPNDPFKDSMYKLLANKVPNECVNLNDASAVAVISVDPTYSFGTTSCIGVCTAIHLQKEDYPSMIMIGGDTINIAQYSHASDRLHCLVVQTHVMIVRVLYPLVPIVLLIEANTFCANNYRLWVTVRDWAKTQGITNFYGFHDRIEDPSRSHPGKMMPQNKLEAVLSLAQHMSSMHIGMTEVLFSVGEYILRAFATQQRAMAEELGANKHEVSVSRFTAEEVERHVKTRNPDQLLLNLSQYLEIPLEGGKGALFAYHQQLLETLKTQITRITIVTDKQGKPRVQTGAKIHGQNGYTHDDLFSAVLLCWLVHPVIFEDIVRVK